MCFRWNYSRWHHEAVYIRRSFRKGSGSQSALHTSSYQPLLRMSSKSESVEKAHSNVKGCSTLRRDVKSRVTLESLASSPYRDALAAFVTACGSIVLVKSTSALHAQGFIDKVRTLVPSTQSCGQVAVALST